MRLADPHQHTEAITSRPLLIHDEMGKVVAIQPSLQVPRQGDRLAAVNLVKLVARWRSPRSRLQHVSGILSWLHPRVRQAPRIPLP